MIRNAPELGTTWAQPESGSHFMTPFARLITAGEIVRLRACLAHRPASRQASTSDQSQIAHKTRSKTTGAAPAWGSAVGSVGIVPTKSQLSTTASGEKHGAFEQLSIVELSEPKKDAGEDQCNDFPARVDD